MNYHVFEKRGKTVTKIKLKIRPNKPTCVSLPIIPKKFMEKAEAVDLSDPIFGNEIYQMLNLVGVQLNPKVKVIVKKCDADDDYKQYVKDTITRCKKDFERNPTIKNKAGFVMKAINTDYYKSQREEQQKQDQQETIELAKKANKNQIETLLKEGKKAFQQRREPHIKRLRHEHLTNAMVQSAIEEHAPSDTIRRKITNTFIA